MHIVSKKYPKSQGEFLAQYPLFKTNETSEQEVHLFASGPVHWLQDLWHGVHKSLFPKYPKLHIQSFPSYLVLGSHVLHYPAILKKPVVQTHCPLFQTLFSPQALQTPSTMFSRRLLQTHDLVLVLKVDLSGQEKGVTHWFPFHNFPLRHEHWPLSPAGIASDGQLDTHWPFCLV